jgi:hypothetical protein
VTADEEHGDEQEDGHEQGHSGRRHPLADPAYSKQARFAGRQGPAVRKCRVHGIQGVEDIVA